MSITATGSTAARRLWLTAGWLTIGYIVITFGAAGLFSGSHLTLGDTPAKATKALVTSSMTSNFAGDAVGLIGLLIFLAGAMLVATLLRNGSPTTAWLSSLMGAGAIGYVAIQLAGGAANVAAVYDGHHGASLSAVTLVNDINNV